MVEVVKTEKVVLEPDVEKRFFLSQIFLHLYDLVPDQFDTQALRKGSEVIAALNPEEVQGIKEAFKFLAQKGHLK